MRPSPATTSARKAQPHTTTQDGAEQADGLAVKKEGPGGGLSSLAERTEFHEKVQRVPQAERQVGGATRGRQHRSQV
jgi:hypothetical protein